MNGFSSSNREGCRPARRSAGVASGCQYESSSASGAAFRFFGIGKCPRSNMLFTRTALRNRLGFPCHPSPTGLVVHSAQTKGLVLCAAYGQRHGSGSKRSVSIEICARQPPNVVLAQLAIRLPTATMADVASESARTRLIRADVCPRRSCIFVPPRGASELKSLTTKCLKPSLPVRAASHDPSSVQHTYL